VVWLRLRLDLDKFDDAQFVAYQRRCQQSGINFTTIANLGDTSECRRALYELNKTCSADIPERGSSTRSMNTWPSGSKPASMTPVESTPAESPCRGLPQIPG
jgi:hypothetical protein